MLGRAGCLRAAPPPLKTVAIYAEPLYLIGPVTDRRLTSAEIRLADVASYPLVMGPRSHTTRNTLEEAAAGLGIKLTMGQELAAESLRRSLILHNGSYTVAAYSMFAEEIEKRLLSAGRIVQPGLSQTVNMIYSASVKPALEQTILAVIQSLVARTPKTLGANDFAAVAAE